MARACIFCGGNGVTAEHVWSKWINEVLEVQRMIAQMGRRGERSWWTANELNSTAKVVCEHCNNEWMSDIENDAKPLLAPMMARGEAQAFGIEAQETIAAWALKNAMVQEHLSLQKSRHYTSAERRLLMEKRRPPANVRIWVGQYKGKWRCHSFAHHLRIMTRGTHIPAHSFTAAVGQFAFQVVSCRAQRMPAMRSLPWRATILPLWPPVPDVALIWPPKLFLTDDMLRKLDDRFVTARSPRR